MTIVGSRQIYCGLGLLVLLLVTTVTTWRDGLGLLAATVCPGDCGATVAGMALRLVGSVLIALSIGLIWGGVRRRIRFVMAIVGAISVTIAVLAPTFRLPTDPVRMIFVGLAVAASLVPESLVRRPSGSRRTAVPNGATGKSA